MSKLAAICAKLKGDAVTVNEVTTPLGSSLEDTHEEDIADCSSADVSQLEPDDISRSSPEPPSLEQIFPLPISSEAVDGDLASLDSAIGLLKRKSIMPVAGGASRRKKQRPISSLNYDELTLTKQTNKADDNQSIDGSEHSLHIDLADEKGDTSQFQQHAFPTASTASTNPGVLQALGLTGVLPDTFSGPLASQSLAAFAEQVSSFKSEPGTSRPVSPAYASEDSLNDSNFKSSDKSGSSGKKKKPLDPSKYLTRYSSAQECGSSHCSGMNYREHYHCMDCTSRIIVKKEEMVRHYKWHQKREDSLQHGFMRYSPFDDCTAKFGPCAHNKKQTHYHCIQSGCNKVYVSTSDVQMHANYHRKASAIILEGFQRFRATEDCGTPNCDFYSQRTTHFHCRRQACNYTFKNKADMEKHKTYHQKDEILSKDGFKKYMKYEHCPYPCCAYSKLSNHIHCMRPGCQYVLHSTSQLYPHKRKHEKQDADLYASYSKAENLSKGEPSIYSSPPTLSAASTNDSQSMTTGSASSATRASDLLSTVARLSQGLMPMVKEERSASTSFKGDKSVPVNPFEPAPLAPSPLQQQRMREAGTDADEEATSDSVSNHSAEQMFDKSLNLTPGRVLEPAAMNWKTERSNRLTDHAKSMMGHFKIATSGGVEVESVPVIANSKGANSGEKHTELWKKYLTRYTANDPCNPRCWLLYKDHYHCNVEKCFNAFKNKDGVRDHARLHDNQERISKQLFSEFPAGSSCDTEGCQYSGAVTHYHCKWMNCSKVIALDDDIFARFDHFQEHELASRISQATMRRNSTNPTGGVKPFAKKRGRPPKTSIFPGMVSGEDLGLSDSSPMNEYNVNYSKFDSGMPCYDELCKFRRETHYHCNVQRCHIATNRLDVMRAHSVNFHSYIRIPENYAYFDRNVNCRGVHCSNNRNSCHYHCLRPGCEHSFIRHTTVTQHDKKHREESRSTPMPQPPPLTNYGALVASQVANVETSGGEEVYSHNGMPTLNDPSRSSEGVHRQQATHEEEFDPRHDTSTSGGKTVKASGTFFPQAGKPEERTTIDLQDESSNGSSSGEEPPSETTPSHRVPSSLPNSGAALPQGNQATAMFNLLAQMSMFLQQRSAQTQPGSQQSQLHSQLQNQSAANAAILEEKDTWQKMLGRMYASPQLPCASVFCKKKQQEHYHCLECNSAFSKAHEAKLKVHLFKHSKYMSHAARAGLLGTPGSVSQVSPSTASQANPSPSGMAGLSHMLLEAMSKSSSGNGKSSTATSTSVSVPDSSTDELPASSSSIQDMMMTALQLQVVSNGRGDSNSADLTSDSQSNNQSDREDVENESEADSSKKRTTPSGALLSKSVSSVDCGYVNCAHSKVCEHYHCLREGCSYGVTDKSKLPQHMKRHEKLDQVLGDDFKLHKPQSDCQRADCEFAGKVSHFHCQICPYICTDANRILPHRRNHSSSNTQSNSIFNSSTDIHV